MCEEEIPNHFSGIYVYYDVTPPSVYDCFKYTSNFQPDPKQLQETALNKVFLYSSEILLILKKT